MKIYIATFCPCIFESAYGVLSVHRFKKNAEASIRLDKKKHGKTHSWEKWRVEKYDIKDFA